MAKSFPLVGQGFIIFPHEDAIGSSEVGEFIGDQHLIDLMISIAFHRPIPNIARKVLRALIGKQIGHIAWA